MTRLWIWLLFAHDRLYWVMPRLWSRAVNDFLLRRIR